MEFNYEYTARNSRIKELESDIKFKEDEIEKLKKAQSDYRYQRTLEAMGERQIQDDDLLLMTSTAYQHFKDVPNTAFGRGYRIDHWFPGCIMRVTFCIDADDITIGITPVETPFPGEIVSCNHDMAWEMRQAYLESAKE